MSTARAADPLVVIAGGGPVGLFLGCCLAKARVRFLILERRTERFGHSRSIGVHPVSLELLEAIGLSAAFIAAGVRVDRGRAIASDGRTLGTLSFTSCPPPFRFVLSLPQPHSEALLEQRLDALAPGCLLRGATVERLVARDNDIEVRFRARDGEQALPAAFVIACDGRDSTLRQHAGIAFAGGRYPDRFVMGDFADTTGLGREAAVFLHRDGLVESFPLPGRRRRWVVRLDPRRDQIDAGVGADDLRRLVAQRCLHDLSGSENTMFSRFGIERFLASTFTRDRLLLAGDAAHVISPIGGQGMNLGWQDAWEAARALAGIIRDGHDHTETLVAYSQKRRDAARAAIRRAAFYTALGRRRSWPWPRDALVRLVLNTRLARPAARLFTMRTADSAAVSAK